ncbi:unnamed protein product [Blepharisma stoltei]|uniref:Uncharacterized protein n=1 Tax=Blepharisma stoltei TaxID=1481888 RepID=A0AAU9JK93_9CILI|nr:unnamed protein product [Blepharisma stoltei]
MSQDIFKVDENGHGHQDSLRGSSKEIEERSNSRSSHVSIENGDQNHEDVNVEFEPDQEEIAKITRKSEMDPNYILHMVPLYCWWYGVLFLLFITMCLILGCMGTSRWIYQGKDDTKWRGGMLKCGGCSGPWEDNYYSTIATECCDDNDYTGFCTTFKHLRDAGIGFAVFEAVTLALLTCWLLKVYILIRGFYFLSDKVSIIIASSTLASHTIALGIWYGVTEAGFSSCDDITTIADDYDICASHGPILIIVNELLFAIILGIFILLLKKRYQAKEIKRDIELT